MADRGRTRAQVFRPARTIDTPAAPMRDRIKTPPRLNVHRRSRRSHRESRRILEGIFSETSRRATQLKESLLTLFNPRPHTRRKSHEQRYLRWPTPTCSFEFDCGERSVFAHSGYSKPFRRHDARTEVARHRVVHVQEAVFCSGSRSKHVVLLQPVQLAGQPSQRL